MYVSKVELAGDYDITRPKNKANTDMHPYLMLEPTKVDFRKPVLFLFVTYIRMKILTN